MKALYFDCASGIAGNMVIGALLELVDDEQWFYDEIGHLHLEDYVITVSKEIRNDVSATYVDIQTRKNAYYLSDLLNLINDADINLAAKDLSRRVLRRMAKAERKVRNVSLEEAFLNRDDMESTLIEIVGTALLIAKLSPELIFSSVVNDGYGFVDNIYGTIPVPLPTTSEIFAASSVITRQIGINTDLVTPTGAAIIAELCEIYGPMPAMDVQKIGWGAGQKLLIIPNVLKISMGEVTKYPDEKLLWSALIDDISNSRPGCVITQIGQKQ